VTCVIRAIMEGRFKMPDELHVNHIDQRDTVISRHGKEIYSDRKEREKQKENGLYDAIVKVKEPKMTKEDAIEKVINKFFHRDNAHRFLGALEALGLIKFDEPELTINEKISMKLNNSVSVKQVTDVLDMLNHLGYTFDPKENKS